MAGRRFSTKRDTPLARVIAGKQEELPFDSALARQMLGQAIPGRLLGQPESPRWIEDDSIVAVDPRAVPGQRERVQTPYGPEARDRAQAEADRRSADVVDYTGPRDEHPRESIRERVLRSMPNWKRRDASVREAEIRRAEAEASGDLIEQVPIDWAAAAASDDPEDQAAYGDELARKQAELDGASTGPHRFGARFTRGTNPGKGDEPEMMDAPWSR